MQHFPLEHWCKVNGYFSIEIKKFRFNHVLESVQNELAHLSSRADPPLWLISHLCLHTCVTEIASGPGCRRRTVWL